MNFSGVSLDEPGAGASELRLLITMLRLDDWDIVNFRNGRLLSCSIDILFVCETFASLKRDENAKK